ncbi:endonuclease/exonuclease/phosphatase family protein [soil metagenome]
MAVLEIAILTLSFFFIAGTLAPLLNYDHWLIRDWDFPRLQVAGALAILLIAGCVVYPFSAVGHYLLNISLALCLAGQLVQIFPYTPLSKKQVKQSKKSSAAGSLSMLSSNVYMPNRNVEGLLKLVQQKQPHMLLTLETNLWWEQGLSALEKDYPYTVKVPLENLYGMHLYSKLPLTYVQVEFLMEPGIPSIHACAELENGELVTLHCLHPMPPSPTESKTSTNRDAELLLVGKSIDTRKGPVIVLGDLNDVAWSRTTRLFQKISGLLDPRKGRGFFNTYNAKYPFMRWPLDHMFHSNHFTLINIERLPTIGSDHFPMYLSLHLEPQARQKQEEPEADAGEMEWAEEKIEEGMG